MEEIKPESGLELLKVLDDNREDLELKRKEAINAILTPEIKQQLDEVNSIFDKQTEEINRRIKEIEQSIKESILIIQKTVKCSNTGYMAIYSKGRTSWDANALNDYALTHPEINELKTVGKPSISIKRKP